MRENSQLHYFYVGLPECFSSVTSSGCQSRKERQSTATLALLLLAKHGLLTTLCLFKARHEA